LSGYLTRLVTRGPETAAEVLPFVRSGSPVAEEDQRVGVPGFEDAGFAIPESVHQWLNPNPPADRAVPLSPVDEPDITVPDSVAGKAQSGPAAAKPGLEPRARSAEPAGHPAGTRVMVRAQPVPGIDPAPSVHHRSLRQILAAATDSSPQVDSSSPGHQPATPGPRTDVTVRRETQAAPGGEPDGGVAPKRHLPAILRSTTPALEPVVQRPHQPDRIRAGTDARDGGEPLPRVFIGRINVEVVSQKADPGSLAVSRSLPATAESVSVIGPLRKGMSTNRRISLRHR
jgi:hypothetical protein